MTSLSEGVNVLFAINKLYKITMSLLIITMLYMPSAIYSAVAAEEPTSSSIDAVFVIDFSKSMNYSDPEGLSIEAFKMFIDLCNIYGDRIGVVAYTDEILKEMPLHVVNSEYDREILKSSLGGIPYGNHTDIGLGLKKAAELLESGQPSFNRPFIILLSDGINDVKGSHRTKEQSMEDMETALRTAVKNEYKIYAIGLNIDNSVNVEELKQLAEKTKGQAFITDKADDIPGLFNTIFNDYVAAANNSPVVTGVIKEIKMNIRNVESVDLSGIFSDADRDALKFRFVMANEDIADIEVSDGKIHITPIKKGTSELVLTAEDPRGASASIKIILHITTYWYKYIMYIALIIIPAIGIIIYRILKPKGTLKGELAIQIRDESTGHTKAPYHVKFEHDRKRVTLHELLQFGKGYGETDRIYISPGRNGRLNIKNLSSCLLQKDGKIIPNKKYIEIRSNEKIMVTLTKAGKSIIIQYVV